MGSAAGVAGALAQRSVNLVFGPVVVLRADQAGAGLAEAGQDAVSASSVNLVLRNGGDAAIASVRFGLVQRLVCALDGDADIFAAPALGNAD